MKKLLRVMMLVALMSPLQAAKKPTVAKMSDSDAFYVYANKADKRNHFIPSGWMGDYGDLKFDDANREDPVDGATAVKITYNAKQTQGAGWSGIYWQIPANNWGEKAGGFDLKGYKRLTFWAKASTDNVQINEFKVGGITGTYSDSGSAAIGPIALTKDWKKYTIEMADADLSHTIGGFCWATARDVVPEAGFVMYLDEIRYEK